MSRPSDKPWTEEEKVYLLTEILRISQLHSSNFLDLIEKANIVPRWDDIPLPQGRPLRSCQNAFEEMRQARRNTQFTAAPMTATYHTYSTSPQFVHHPTLPRLQPSQSITRKRPFHDVETTPTTTPRILQPRPAGPGQAMPPFTPFSGSEAPASSMRSPSETADEPARKKRGRPSKDEIHRREAEAAARGEVYTPKKRAPKKAIENLTGGPATESTAAPGTAETKLPSPQSSPRPQRPSPVEASARLVGPSVPDLPDPTSPATTKTAAAQMVSSSDSRQTGGDQPSSPETHFVHRPSGAIASPIPRYQPLLAPANTTVQQSKETSGASGSPTYPPLYDTRNPSRHS